MDLASVVAALASVGVRVSGSTPNSSVQVDSSRACPTGLAGPEPSGTVNDPGQHFHGSRGYLNVVPLVSQPQLAPQYGPVDSAAPGDVTITLPWCCANEALRGMPCASPSCPRRAQISSCGDPNYHPNPSRNWPSSSWNLPAYCSSLLILSHFRFIHPDSVPIQPKSGQIKQILPHRGYISIFFWDLPALRSSLT